MALSDYRIRFPHPDRPSLRKVAMRDREWKTFTQTIAARSKARLEHVIGDYCENGPDELDETDFKFIGHFSHGGLKVRMEEFKARHVRLFGFCTEWNGRATFFVTGIDPVKKQDKICKRKFKAAGLEAVSVVQSLNDEIAKRKERR